MITNMVHSIQRKNRTPNSCMWNTDHKSVPAGLGAPLLHWPPRTRMVQHHLESTPVSLAVKALIKWSLWSYTSPHSRWAPWQMRPCGSIQSTSSTYSEQGHLISKLSKLRALDRFNSQHYMYFPNYLDSFHMNSNLKKNHFILFATQVKEFSSSKQK